MPKIVAGSSVGSLLAGIVGTHTREELLREFTPRMIEDGIFYSAKEPYTLVNRLKMFFSKGHTVDMVVFERFVRSAIGEYTFQEAYDKTGIILNITATDPEHNDTIRLLNYLTAPNVMIWSAVCASCAIPYVFPAHEILCKNHLGEIVPYIPERSFIDGSLAADLPTQNLSELFNVNCFIVSQVNPWVVPFMSSNKINRRSMLGVLTKILEFMRDVVVGEIKHRFNQLVQFHLVPVNLKKWVNLVTQNYHGHLTIFPIVQWRELLGIVDNPTPEDFMRCEQGSAVRTYAHVSFIKNIMTIEMALDKHYRSVKRRILYNLSRMNLTDDGKENVENSPQKSEV
jgi:TAG lipase/steryl ester hydrolase/phospholipase A2/LPA acyltransferase